MTTPLEPAERHPAISAEGRSRAVPAAERRGRFYPEAVSTGLGNLDPLRISAMDAVSRMTAIRELEGFGAEDLLAARAGTEAGWRCHTSSVGAPSRNCPPDPYVVGTCYPD
jgi:hypothetical protein